MNRTVITILLLTCSNVFMTFAWYGHLKNMSHRSWLAAAIVSWGIALFEYLIQVPANRIGREVMNVGQLKLLQEIITLSVFVPFAWLHSNAGLAAAILQSQIRSMGANYHISWFHLI